MTDFWIEPDLYKGSALSLLCAEMRASLQKRKGKVHIIAFEPAQQLLKHGLLDDPEVFWQHQLRVLEYLKHQLKSGDRILFGDFFQPALALLHYYAHGRGMQLHYSALFHGGSFVPGDIFADQPWLQPFEAGIVGLLQSVYVPSMYAASCFPAAWQERLRVKPYGFNTTNYNCMLNPAAKRFDIVLPHRWSHEKGAHFLAQLIQALPHRQFALSELGGEHPDPALRELYRQMKGLPQVTIIGSEAGLTYKEALQQSKIVVAASDQELFGYSLREAIASGCIPICRQACCYPELLPSQQLFGSLSEAIDLIEVHLGSYPDGYLALPSTSFDEILNDFFGEVDL